MLLAQARAAEISIVRASDPSPVAATAAEELAHFLGALHDQDRFTLVATAPASGMHIRLAASSDAARELGIAADDLAQPGAFRVTAAGERGIIAAASPKALLDGVYTLLEQVHGQGFYLSENASEGARGGAFNYDGWDLHDWPLIAERSIMAWPNFLSGCSTWNRAEWLQWVRQAARMRATHLLFHTYANNPLLQIVLDGHERPVGWMNSSRKGRTYAVEHIWDVRNIPGAEGLYQEAWFGSEAAKVPDAERVVASRELMAAVFEEAHRFGLKNVWAIDVDTYEAHPQEMIEAVLKPEDIIESGQRNWKLIKPDSAGGYRWHKTLIDTITSSMPAIDRLIVWVRAGNMSPGMGMDINVLPADWQADLAAQTPDLKESEDAGWKEGMCKAGIYYASKVAESWKRALDELDRDVEVGFGSWTWMEKKFLVANKVFPPEAPFYLKDYNNGIRKGDSAFSTLETDRHIVPIAYVHHDDGHQCGPPLGLPDDLLSSLQSFGATGHAGVIWLTRPLDLYFRSAWDRLWQSGRDRSHEDACRRMAADFVDAPAQAAFAAFLEAWSKKGETFGRETSDEFGPIKRGKHGLETRDDKAGKTIEKIIEKLAKGHADIRPPLQQAAQLATSGTAKKRIAYFQHYLDWVTAYFDAQLARANADRTALAKRPEEAAIRAFSQAALCYNTTAGERGQVASLASRWQTFFVQQRQHMGLEPIRLRCMPTNHDHRARKPGTRSFHYDAEGGTWLVLGEEETGHKAVLGSEDGNAIANAWIQADRQLTLLLQDVRGERKLPAGDFRVRMHLPNPVRGAAQKVSLRIATIEQQVDWHGAMVVEFDAPLHVAADQQLDLILQATDGGTVGLSGVELLP